MKISIMDLMDHYYGEEGAALAASNRPSRNASGAAPASAKFPLLRPLRIAAAFLLVVGITGALFWGFGAKKGTSSGNSLQQENAPEPSSVSTPPPRPIPPMRRMPFPIPSCPMRRIPPIRQQQPLRTMFWTAPPTAPTISATAICFWLTAATIP